jgi:hypothetical protein
MHAQVFDCFIIFGCVFLEWFDEAFVFHLLNSICWRALLVCAVFCRLLIIIYSRAASINASNRYIISFFAFMIFTT